MFVYFCEVVADGVHNCLAILSKLGSSVEGRDEVRKLLVLVKEELDTSQARFFGFEHESPANLFC